MSTVLPRVPSPSPEAPPSPAPRALVLDGVSKHYSTGTSAMAALSNVSLDIGPGELTVLMGPSGSGKTTLLSIMGGILRPTNGRVTICGHDVADMTEPMRSRVRLAHIGFIFQSYNLFPTLTARQNVEIALELKGLAGAARRTEALALLNELGLGDKANSYPADLSGGQKQRVAVARALAGTPEIILADEPTAALDLVNGRRIMKAFRDLAKAQRRAVVIVTHDSRILDFADRAIRMEDGRIMGDFAMPKASRPDALTANLICRPSLVDDAWSP